MRENLEEILELYEKIYKYLAKLTALTGNDLHRATIDLMEINDDDGNSWNT